MMQPHNHACIVLKAALVILYQLFSEIIRLFCNIPQFFQLHEHNTSQLLIDCIENLIDDYSLCTCDHTPKTQKIQNCDAIETCSNVIFYLSWSKKVRPFQINRMNDLQNPNWRPTNGFEHQYISLGEFEEAAQIQGCQLQLGLRDLTFMGCFLCTLLFAI